MNWVSIILISIVLISLSISIIKLKIRIYKIEIEQSKNLQAHLQTIEILKVIAKKIYGKDGK